jgi:hypothetical protein
MRNRSVVWKPLILLALVATACSGPSSASSAWTASPRPSAASSEAAPTVLSADEVSALDSLTLVDGYPLYTMQFHASSDALSGAELPLPGLARSDTSWWCSLFAALADPQSRVYGRNFDWDYSPALLLFYTPADGYASVSMVDIGFLGFTSESARGLDKASLAERAPLLHAPALPFDGMNAKGLVVGMAAVPTAIKADDLQKPTIGSIGVIRQMLDHAANVDEAIGIFRSYNVDMGGGPPIHYLIADASGKAALLEFSKGELVVTPNEKPWHQATNFIRAEAGADPESQCWRYAILSKTLTETQGSLTPPAALDLLSSVAQDMTQWSVVYQISSGDVWVAMGRDYARAQSFHLTMES